MEIAFQAIWAIGNISGDCAANRDSIIKCGGLTNLVSVVNKLIE